MSAINYLGILYLVPFSQHSLHPVEASPPENVFDFKLTNHLLNAVSNLPLQTSSSLPSQFTYTNDNSARSSSLSLSRRRCDEKVGGGGASRRGREALHFVDVCVWLPKEMSNSKTSSVRKDKKTLCVQKLPARPTHLLYSHEHSRHLPNRKGCLAMPKGTLHAWCRSIKDGRFLN